jgi:Protein of unknown function (DUF4012)
MGWRGPRRVPKIAVAAVGLVVLAAAVAVPAGRGLESGLAADVRSARADFERGRQQLEDGYRLQDPALVETAAGSFARSRTRLQALARTLAPYGAARGPASPAPLRDRLVTLDAVIRVADHLDRAGETAARTLLATGLVGPPGRSAPPPAGGSPLVADLTARLASMRGDLAAAGRAAAAIDLTLLPAGDRAALGRALGDLRVVVSGLEALWPSLGAVLDLLGLAGPRTYLVEQVNPAELRSGGGFIGTVSLVHAELGRVTLAASLPVEAFDYCDADACVHPRPQPWQPGYVAPPAELTGPPLPPWSRLTAWSLEDSGFFPDFASSATTAEAFARRLLGVPIDGVIAIDYYAVAPLLDLTGPIELPKYGLTLTSANFVDTVVGQDLARDYAHKDVIAAAAAQIVAGLSRMKPADLPRLLRIVEDMTRARHLQVHFDDAGVQREAARLGATDVLNPAGAGEFLLETEDNYGGSKANYFLERRFTLDLSRSGPVLHHLLTVDLHDRAPADKPFIGPHYYAYLRLTVPAGATSVTVSSAPSGEYEPIQAPGRRTQLPPAGAQVAGGWIFVDVGQELSGRYRATFEWDTAWAPGPDGSVELYWQKQPGTVHDAVRVIWASAAGTVSATGDLTTDLVVTLGPDRVAIEPATHGLAR